MATTTRSTIIAAYRPGLYKLWKADQKDHPTFYDKIFTVVKSSRAYEELAEIIGLGLAEVKPEAASSVYDTPAQGPVTRFVHIAYSKGYIITKEAIADNLYKEMSVKRIMALNRSFRITKEIVSSNVLNRAFNGDFVGGDGQPLLSAAHPSSVGSYSNTLDVPADLSEASLETMLTQMRRATDARGLPMSIQSRALIVPPELAFEAERILFSDGRAGTDLNDVNVIKRNSMFPGGIIINPYLVDPNAWFIKTDALDGLMMFQREPYTFTEDNDFDTDNAKAKGYERYSVGWANPRALYGSPGG